MKTVLDVNAVEAMLNDPYLMTLVRSVYPRDTIDRQMRRAEELNDIPDWIVAGYNCKDNNKIKTWCVHTFLMDWKPEDEK